MASTPRNCFRASGLPCLPRNRERHFIVTRLIRDEQDEHVVEVVLQAVLTRRDLTLAWRELKEDGVWQMGWK
ncbi:TIGR02450 family Trp-rich protein [Cobetia sp.]|uniref:TIGR02450 family Trp-rich protein n=1 Tax=Cobetia sp. TaxID=1873876 RepID=UPI0030EF33DE